jgi:cytochrome P450
LSNEDILAAARVIIFGGLETTAAMLTNTVWALLSHPSQYETVLSHPHLLTQAIEEALRWEPPVQSCTRFVTRPVVVRGVELAPGEMVQCMVGLRILFERLPGLRLDAGRPSSPRGHEFRYRKRAATMKQAAFPLLPGLFQNRGGRPITL